MLSFLVKLNVGKLESSEEWSMNSYTFNLNKMLDDVELKEDLIELISNCALEMQLESKTVLLKCNLRVKLWKSIGAQQWLHFKGFVKWR